MSKLLISALLLGLTFVCFDNDTVCINPEHVTSVENSFHNPALIEVQTKGGDVLLSKINNTVQSVVKKLEKGQ